MCEPAVDAVLNEEPPGAPGERVPGVLVPPAGRGPVQGAGLGERLEIVGAGLSTPRFLLLGLPDGGGRRLGGELVLEDRVGRRVVDAAGGGEQLHDPLPLGELGRAALVTEQVLAVAVEVLLPAAVSSAAAASAAFMPVARRRTTRRPIRARSAGSRRTGAPDAGTRARRRG
ncbi:hypothetical protein [Streptomyces sp. NPDC090093]|uniref:hypothetical protein n=1 Tax=Streptomyces sp. NPDC090093 TaxID=3365945 RepID=UPI003824FDEA